MVKQTLLVIYFGLAESLETFALEEMEADLVSCTSCTEHWWIHQALGLPTKWWVPHSNNIPILLEIRKRNKAN